MDGLIHVVMFVGTLTAFIAWSIAGLSALAVARIAPRGEKLNSSFELGRWRFAALETRLGPAVTPHLVRYRRAFLVSFAAICAMIVLALSTSFLKPA